MRREIELGSAVEANRSDSDGLGDAAIVGRCATARGRLQLRSDSLSVPLGTLRQGPEAGLKVRRETNGATGAAGAAGGASWDLGGESSVRPNRW